MVAPRLFFIASLVLAVCALAQARYTRWHELFPKRYDFKQFVREYGKVYTSSEEETFRRRVFNANLKHVLHHNSQPGLTWKMGINHLSDRTQSELAALRGYKKEISSQDHVVDARASMASDFNPLVGDLPTSVDWRQKGAITPVKDQGMCGSCWTFASAEEIESMYFLKTGSLVELSEQQIASCTSNPLDCGGTGGCEGGTAEVAFQSIITVGGIASEWTYPYISYNGTDYACRLNSSHFTFSPVAKLRSYVKLPTNDQNALMQAVATIGPIAISVDASAWSFYETGVFSGCNMKSPDIDHAVQLVGYGTDSKLGDYWIVRNSWTPTWGEAGFIRIQRTANPVCGVDPTPGDGTACKPYPANVTVCGMCGMLSDSAYPILE